MRVLGFPVTVHPGFLGFTALLAALNARDPRFAAVLAGSFAVFTLVHELGHALAARRFGANAAISLSFLVGLAEVKPTRPLARWERAVITAAGPLTAVAAALVVLAATGNRLIALSSSVDDRLATAVRWTGVALGLLNLLPLMPLDGGNLLALATDRLWPGRGRDVVQWWTVAACVAAAVAIALRPRWLLWAVSVALLAAWNVHALRVGRRASRLVADTDEADTAREVERAAWASGVVGRFPDGWVASPWVRARQRLLRGDADGARTLLARSLTAPSRAWALPSGASTDELATLVALVPDDAPVDQMHGAFALQTILHEVGFLRRAADYGAAAYAQHRSPEIAHQVARSLTLLGDGEGAVVWLREAHTTTADVGVLDDAELESLHDLPDFGALRYEIADRSSAADR